MLWKKNMLSKVPNVLCANFIFSLLFLPDEQKYSE